MEAVYAVHTLMEAVLGVIKLRGRYAHESPTERGERSRMYVRHHASSLIALTVLGGYVWWRDLVWSETGWLASLVLGIFHGGAVCAFLWAWACGAIPMAKVIAPHAPFALAFLWHVARYDFE